MTYVMAYTQTTILVTLIEWLQVRTYGDTPKSDKELEDKLDRRELSIENAVNKIRAEGRNRTKTVATLGRPAHNAKVNPLLDDLVLHISAFNPI